MVFQKYIWREGYRSTVSAQRVGERLAEIEAASGGHVTPRDVVEDARPEDSPLHGLFTWDAEQAARNWNIAEAQRAIRCCVAVIEAPGRAPEVVLARVNVVLPECGHAYVTTTRAMSEPALAAQVRAEAIRAFQALQRRYAHIDGLEDLFAEVDRLVAGDGRRRRRRAVAAAGRAERRPPPPAGG